MSVALREGASQEVRAAADRMAVFLSRFIRDGELVFHGVASPLPMAAIVMARTLMRPA